MHTATERNLMRTYAQQKAGLTRALKTKSHAKVEAECRRTVEEWETGTWTDNRGRPCRPGVWPDDWARWQRALDDVSPSLYNRTDLREL